MDPRVLVCAQRGPGHVLQQNKAVLLGSTKPFGTQECSKGLGPVLQQNRAVLQVCPCPGLRIEKWTLQCSCVCNLWGQGHVLQQDRAVSRASTKLLRPRALPLPAWGFGSKNAPSSARVRRKESGPRSAAKQGRSSRMAVLNHSGSRVLTPAQERKQITFSSYLEVNGNYGT